jgi:plasmid stabilization system protein ParE
VRVELADRARLDIQSIANAIAGEHPFHVKKFIARLGTTLDNLAAFPEIGRESERQGVRQIPLRGYPYVVVYQVSREAIYVTRVIHGAMDWPPRSKSDDE